MNDDWRVRVDVRDDGLARSITEQLNADELEHDLNAAFHDRIVLSVDGPVLFAYAGSREQAQRAADLVGRLATEHKRDVTIEVAHWHPVSEEWESPDEPEPVTAADAEHEREERVEDEREESAEQGYPDFEVRVQLHSRHDASELSHRLDSEGIAHVHRWSYLLIGATDEDSAQALAERLRGEAPPGSEVVVEQNRRVVYEHRPFNPFTFLGGLGG
ncbi:MAG TPA: hypothetical protein VMF14_01470 [Solirubrobacteraceae bacterium]|nr:hypothetical protein [Solirubrobacteraceae bacterium]